MLFIFLFVLLVRFFNVYSDKLKWEKGIEKLEEYDLK